MSMFGNASNFLTAFSEGAPQATHEWVLALSIFAGLMMMLSEKRLTYQLCWFDQTTFLVSLEFETTEQCCYRGDCHCHWSWNQMIDELPLFVLPMD